MRSATATPSSSALWASIGPRTTSPIAHTLGRFVRQFSSTAIKPRSSLRPTPSALRPSVLARRPIETMSRSKTALCALPSAPVYSTVTSFFAFTPVIFTPSSIFRPCFVKIFQASLAKKRSEEHTSELQSPDHLVCRLLLEKKNKQNFPYVEVIPKTCVADL